MKSITFSINKNSKKIVFDLSSNYLQQDANFGSFIVDFKSNYTPNYSLATIMGFDYKSLENSINSLYFLKIVVSLKLYHHMNLII